jgi:hypothetical protein
MKALEETVRGIAEFVKELEESGLSIRFINFSHDQDGNFDNLTDLDDIDRKVKMGKYDGGTMIGLQLHQKIVSKIITKAKSRLLKKPVIVAIITDGEVR